MPPRYCYKLWHRGIVAAMLNPEIQQPCGELPQTLVPEGLKSEPKPVQRAWALRLAGIGLSCRKIAKFLSYDASTVARWVKRDANENGRASDKGAA